MKSIKDISYTKLAHPEQKLDVHLPDADTFPVFVYFHGGGIYGGDKKAGIFIEMLQQRGIAVVSANYRMYPEARYPEFVCDAAAAVAWVHKHMSEYGNVTGIFVGGSSAGGYLSQMLCFDKKWLGIHKIDSDTITGYIHDAGQPTAHFNVLRERGIDHKRVIIDEAAPIYHITEGRSYAPMCILVSEFDMENRLEQTKLLMSTMKHMGADMEKVELNFMEGWHHCKYINAPNAEGTYEFVEIIDTFIKKYSEVK